jgi:hypothetical protein
MVLCALQSRHIEFLILLGLLGLNVAYRTKVVRWMEWGKPVGWGRAFLFGQSLVCLGYRRLIFY